MTVCNLNRVNCHSAFVAMYNMKLARENPSLSQNKKVNFLREVHIIDCYCYPGHWLQERMRETYEVTRKLLSNETTNCLLPVCTKIKGQVGKICSNTKLFHIFLNSL